MVQSLWKNTVPILTHDYETWSKQELIDRIKVLELKSNLNSLSVTEKNDTKPNTTGNEKMFDFAQYLTRFIALRFAYLGWNYNGLAFQVTPTPLPTVEEEILQALAKTKLINEPQPGSCNFSRCGRTDKGVSAMNQVISLNVRSSLNDQDQQNSQLDNKELPYMTILNSILPSDIRITAVCLRPPPEFDARFSCKYRHYKYLIHKDGLDIELMNQAAKRYIGVHDFRNFCKLDGSKQITNYSRQVLDANVIPFDDEFYVFDLKGTAFLWHQVRCMVSILLAIGQKLEPVVLIDDLLDVERYPSKPSYEMANEIPLILYDCVYDEMEWLYPKDSPSFHKYVKEFSKLRGMILDYQLKSCIGNIMESIVTKDKNNIEISTGGTMNLGDGEGRNFKNYVPILKREFGRTFEAVNAKYRQKKLCKNL